MVFKQRFGHGCRDNQKAYWVPLALCLLLCGCDTLRYYGQLAEGQAALLRARQPAEQVIAAPGTPVLLQQRLALALRARAFASEQLHLPDNRSYRLYADVHRPFVLWNVFATGEFSLQPVTHCFPIAGCVAYRGYYDQGAARGAAALLRQQGQDVYVGGVETYSTLGWFDDPIISTMARWGGERLATLIFHELAHQRYYVKDDTEFNESYATFVEQEGTRQWRAWRGLPPQSLSQARQQEQFVRLVLDTRDRLAQVYRQPWAPEAMRAAKQAEFERLRREYRQLRDGQWGGQGPYDAWVNGPLNNAKLLPFGLYDQWVPAFAQLFEQQGKDWPRFFRAVQRLGALPAAQRKARLSQLMPPV
ncbi:aminopeptidase [Pseudomonas typographi]|uniref:aminopeptidase n=1 Tax=Pseudomonas typographi TaxID=2715964 RepID=UPI0016872480|nr:aminopeptidase [Pseudomonas typographi]MBD1552925.1 aminopeptidase [Pseudomonas typographi]